MPLPVSAEETSYGSILQTENARQSVKGEENTEDPENQDKENAGGSEDQEEGNSSEITRTIIVTGFEELEEAVFCCLPLAQ